MYYLNMDLELAKLKKLMANDGRYSTEEKRDGEIKKIFDILVAVNLDDPYEISGYTLTLCKCCLSGRYRNAEEYNI
jgi:hypothetical protein